MPPFRIRMLSWRPDSFRPLANVHPGRPQVLTSEWFPVPYVSGLGGVPGSGLYLAHPLLWGAFRKWAWEMDTRLVSGLLTLTISSLNLRSVAVPLDYHFQAWQFMGGVRWTGCGQSDPKSSLAQLALFTFPAQPHSAGRLLCFWTVGLNFHTNLRLLPV